MKAKKFHELFEELPSEVREAYQEAFPSCADKVVRPSICVFMLPQEIHMCGL